MREDDGRIVLTFLKGNNSPGRYGNAVGKLMLSHAAFVSEFPDEIVHGCFRDLVGCRSDLWLRFSGLSDMPVEVAVKTGI